MVHKCRFYSLALLDIRTHALVFKVNEPEADELKLWVWNSQVWISLILNSLWFSLFLCSFCLPLWYSDWFIHISSVIQYWVNYKLLTIQKLDLVFSYPSSLYIMLFQLTFQFRKLLKYIFIGPVAYGGLNTPSPPQTTTTHTMPLVHLDTTIVQ